MCKLTVGELASHSHDYFFDYDASLNWRIGLVPGTVDANISTVTNGVQGREYTFHIRATGNNIPHNNISPYCTAYFYKRIS